jgi:hypothetical protein
MTKIRSCMRGVAALFTLMLLCSCSDAAAVKTATPLQRELLTLLVSEPRCGDVIACEIMAFAGPDIVGLGDHRRAVAYLGELRTTRQ